MPQWSGGRAPLSYLLETDMHRRPFPFLWESGKDTPQTPLSHPLCFLLRSLYCTILQRNRFLTLKSYSSLFLNFLGLYVVVVVVLCCVVVFVVVCCCVVLEIFRTARDDITATKFAKKIRTCTCAPRSSPSVAPRLSC